MKLINEDMVKCQFLWTIYYILPESLKSLNPYSVIILVFIYLFINIFLISQYSCLMIPQTNKRQKNELWGCHMWHLVKNLQKKREKSCHIQHLDKNSPSWNPNPFSGQKLQVYQNTSHVNCERVYIKVRNSSGQCKILTCLPNSPCPSHYFAQLYRRLMFNLMYQI